MSSLVDINVKFPDLKKKTRIDTSKLAAKSDLFSLNAEIDKLDID